MTTNNENEFEHRFNYREAWAESRKRFFYHLHESNEVWMNLVRLIVTTATTLITFTAIFHNNVQSVINESSNPRACSVHVIIGLSSFVGAIIFGICQEIDFAYEQGRQAREFGAKICEYSSFINAGEEIGIQKISKNETYVQNLSIIFGILEIFTFFIGIICILIYGLLRLKFLFGHIFIISTIWGSFILFSIFMFHRYRDRIFLNLNKPNGVKMEKGGLMKEIENDCLEKQFESLGADLGYEANLIAQRTTWFVVSQAFFFTSLAAAIKGDSNAKLKDSLLFPMIPWASLITCIAIFSSVVVAIRIADKIRSKRDEIAEKLKPKSYTKRTQAEILIGLLPSWLLPIVFAYCWVSILNVQ